MVSPSASKKSLHMASVKNLRRKKLGREIDILISIAYFYLPFKSFSSHFSPIMWSNTRSFASEPFRITQSSKSFSTISSRDRIPSSIFCLSFSLNTLGLSKCLDNFVQSLKSNEYPTQFWIVVTILPMEHSNTRKLRKIFLVKTLFANKVGTSDERKFHIPCKCSHAQRYYKQQFQKYVFILLRPQHFQINCICFEYFRVVKFVKESLKINDFPVDLKYAGV